MIFIFSRQLKKNLFSFWIHMAICQKKAGPIGRKFINLGKRKIINPFFSIHNMKIIASSGG